LYLLYAVAASTVRGS